MIGLNDRDPKWHDLYQLNISQESWSITGEQRPYHQLDIRLDRNAETAVVTGRWQYRVPAYRRPE
jgi:hypothetical protein